MGPETTAAIGIDFGTTNSSVAHASAEQVRLVRFRSILGETASSRSLLYFERKSAQAGSKVAAWSGQQAIEKYLAHDVFDESAQGRLIQSLKSHLSDLTIVGTEIFRRKYSFDDLVTKILSDLRLKAMEFLGFEITRAIAGRPVMFVGSKSDADNAFALERLTRCFTQAGFTEVRFVMEPVAAAYAYEVEAGDAETVLIGDFGGGTTDFSLLRLDPKKLLQPRVLGNSGVGVAGDAFDARIVRKLVSPALGSNSDSMSFGKSLPALPAWIYSNLEHWHTLSFLRNHEVRELLRTAEKRTSEPDKIAALRTVIDNDLGYQLHHAVQDLKARLSTNKDALFHLATEAIQIEADVSRSEFNEWMSPELKLIEASLDGLMLKTNLPCSSVDKVVLTGGTSLVPAVREVFTSRFGENVVHSSDAFTSVAHGLALIARGFR